MNSHDRDVIMCETSCLVILLIALFQASATGLQRERDADLAMDETPITITVTQGATAVLPCTVDPRYTEQHKDRYKVVWASPEGTAISIEDRRMINDMRISVERPFLRDWNLHIRNVSITDAGVYMCQINTIPVQVKKVTLQVHVPPMIVDYTQPTEIVLLEGDTVELFCNATGVPLPQVTWYRINTKDNPTMKERKERVGSSGERLVIHNVTRHCADSYLCVADNKVPPATQQEFTVDVHYPPEITVYNTRIGQELGKETILECTVTASPMQNSRWMRQRDNFIFSSVKDKEKYEVNIYELTDERDTITISLRIARVEPDDYSQYLCESFNNYGKASRSMELYEVKTKTHPPPTTITTTTTTTTTTATPYRSKVYVHNSNLSKKPGANGQDVFVNGPHESTNREGGYNESPSDVSSYKGSIFSKVEEPVSEEASSRAAVSLPCPLLLLQFTALSSLCWTIGRFV